MKKASTDSELSMIQQRLREGGVILILALALFMLIALITYHKADPGWSQTALMHSVTNSGGKAGAWFSDLFLYLFGYVAYLLPIGVGSTAVILFKSRKSTDEVNYALLALRLSGFIILLTSGCILAGLHFVAVHTHLPFQAGGIIGAAFAPKLLANFNLLGTTLILISTSLFGLTLYSGISWIRTVDELGRILLNLFVFMYEQYTVLKIFFENRRIAKAAEKKRLERMAPRVVNNPPVKKPKKSIPIALPKKKKSTSVRAERDKQVPLFDTPIEGDLPPLSLLEPAEDHSNVGFTKNEIEILSRMVEEKLKDFGVDVKVLGAQPGPVITRFELDLAPGIKVSKLTGLVKDLARSLSMTSVRIVEVIPGKSVVGLEIPNTERAVVRLSEVISSEAYDKAQSPLSMALGLDISGHSVVIDLAKMPHLLVAGTTGAGKSVGLNAMLLSVLFKSTPEQVRMILIDPKMLELAIYEGVPHLLTPVVTDMKEAANALRWCVAEMDRRYRLMAALGVRNLSGFNHKVRDAAKKGKPILDPLWKPQGFEEEVQPPLETLPLIVVVVDEFADMMMVVGKKVEELIARIAQKARAAGIHLILATQRPSVDVITGLIKANVPSRISFQVSSRVDSRTILDQQGAEQLLGQGDMLYLPPGSSVPVRVHGAFVADQEVHDVVSDWKRRGEPNYLEEVIETRADNGQVVSDDMEDGEQDELYDQAVRIVTETRKASISGVQRRLRIGYNRAARLIEVMEQTGIVSPMESNGSREVLAPPPPAD